MAAEVAADNFYTLCGCTVAPAFDYKDLELGNRTSLIEEFPQHREIIEMLSVKSH